MNDDVQQITAQIRSQLVDYMRRLRAAKHLVRAGFQFDLNASYLRRYNFLGFRNIHGTLVPAWAAVNPREPAKYKPHQGARECARRKQQCMIQASGSGALLPT